VRESATGRLVAQDRSVLATGLAALADGRTFVIAEEVGQSCATRLYRVRLNGRGQPGALSPLPVPVLPGELASLTAFGLAANSTITARGVRVLPQAACSPPADCLSPGDTRAW
jgi:hypothetical protein